MRIRTIILCALMIMIGTAMSMAGAQNNNFSQGTGSLLESLYRHAWSVDPVNDVLRTRTYSIPVDATTPEVNKKLEIMKFINGNPGYLIRGVWGQRDDNYNPVFINVVYEEPVTPPTSPTGGR